VQVQITVAGAGDGYTFVSDGGRRTGDGMVWTNAREGDVLRFDAIKFRSPL